MAADDGPVTDADRISRYGNVPDGSGDYFQAFVIDAGAAQIGVEVFAAPAANENTSFSCSLVAERLRGQHAVVLGPHAAHLMITVMAQADIDDALAPVKNEFRHSYLRSIVTYKMAVALAEAAEPVSVFWPASGVVLPSEAFRSLTRTQLLPMPLFVGVIRQTSMRDGREYNGFMTDGAAALFGGEVVFEPAPVSFNWLRILCFDFLTHWCTKGAVPPGSTYGRGDGEKVAIEARLKDAEWPFPRLVLSLLQGGELTGAAPPSSSPPAPAAVSAGPFARRAIFGRRPG
ncbi:hypothetical protein ACG873_24625 [Mesorhizobium sp. AaZ16]|uniref:hypothetical protein n=1 Tax=Mesorhizobium sp. AaZ16 TaxID=3402289 RepID=UPI00374F602B